MSNKLKKKPSTRLSPETMTAAEVSGITGVKLEIIQKGIAMPYAVMPEVTRGVVKTVFEGFGGGEEE